VLGARQNAWRSLVDQVHDKLPLCPRRALCLVLFSFLPLLAGCLSNSLTSLQVLPPTGTATVTVGQTSQFQALAGFTKSGHASTAADVTTQAKWQSSNPAVATINSGGLATGVSAGTAAITASMQGAFGIVTGTSNITVTAGTGGRVLTALTVTPGSQTITATGQTAQLIAIGTYTAAPLTQNLSATATWTSSNVQVANVNSSGLVAGVAVGQTTVTAFATASDGSVISANATITVATAPSGRILISLSVIPPSQSVSVAGETAQFIAIGTYSAAPLTLDLTNQVAWQSSDVQVGQVNSSGLVTGIGSTTDPTVPGVATITALATASDGSVVPASGTFSELSPAVPPSLPTLTVYEVGNGTGTVTAGTSISGGVITGTVVITCGSGPACTGNFAVGTAVFLAAVPATGSKFDGWSANCVPIANNANACSITMNNNATVGAIFDPITP
jgi:Bacterial Ig-like domain (group 2)/Divergent InlB B-repeat domain